MIIFTDDKTFTFMFSIRRAINIIDVVSVPSSRGYYAPLFPECLMPTSTHYFRHLKDIYHPLPFFSLKPCGCPKAKNKRNSVIFDRGGMATHKT